jgi:tetratricopeptide (TPR) repeat protein
VLEKLERFPEALAAVEAVLERNPDFVPAIVKQVQLESIGGDEEYDEDSEEEKDDEALAREAAGFAEQARRNEQRLRRALALDPSSVDALRGLSGLLRYREHPALDEADRLFDRAIALAPDRADLLEERANNLRSQALISTDAADPADVITTFAGMRYSRSLLERSLADYRASMRLSGETRLGMRIGSLLHDLGRYDEALAAYDEVLVTMPADDPRRSFFLEHRARSENNGAGEREQMARMLEMGIGSGDRNLQDDMAAQALLSAANAVRGGKSLSAALEARLPDGHPDDMMAANIAMQILNVGNEPPPRLAAVDPKEFPAYQRKFVDQRGRELAALGLRHVADAEAEGMRMMLGQRVLIGMFADDSGETGVACFAMKPKWPGWLAWLIMFVTGKWKVYEMTECVTQFDDDTHLSTQYESPSPFEYGPPIHLEKLPRKASLTELVARHSGRVAEYRRAHPDAEPMRVTDLGGMEARWIEGQRVKRAYRESVGFVTDAELRKLLGGHYARFADRVRAKLAVLAADLV